MLILISNMSLIAITQRIDIHLDHQLYTGKKIQLNLAEKKLTIDIQYAFDGNFLDDFSNSFT